MLEPSHNDELPAIPGKRYFTIGEVSDLCDVKPHVLRYWEQEFPQLKPVKRRGNRRYYQRQDVLMIRQIRSLLYDQGFTIGGARQQLSGGANAEQATQYHQLIKQMIVEMEEVLDVLKDTPGIGVTHFAAKDVVRHPLVQRIIEAYDMFESQQEVEERARREVRQQERDARMQSREGSWEGSR